MDVILGIVNDILNTTLGTPAGTNNILVSTLGNLFKFFEGIFNFFIAIGNSLDIVYGMFQ